MSVIFVYTTRITCVLYDAYKEKPRRRIHYVICSHSGTYVSPKPSTLKALKARAPKKGLQHKDGPEVVMPQSRSMTWGTPALRWTSDSGFSSILGLTDLGSTGSLKKVPFWGSL